MQYMGAALAVSDIQASRKFYEDLLGMEVFQDYGINISFTEGLSLQQDFDWLLGIPKEEIGRRTNNMELYFEETQFDDFVNRLAQYPGIEYLGGVKEQPWGQRSIRFYDLDKHIIEVGEVLTMVIRRFQAEGMRIEDISKRMDISVSDLEKLLDEK